MIRVMFLRAVARPRYNADGECTFHGKIGMWPFVERLPARRRSVNRERGMIETRLVSCTRARYRQLLIDNEFKARWPNRHNRDKHIILEQDGAAAHIDPGDFEFRLHANEGRWRIELFTQSLKSPDVNVLDLSFLCTSVFAVAAWGRKHSVLVHAFLEFEPRKIDFVFITLQQCMDDIFLCMGGNDYQLKHMGKQALLHVGELPRQLPVSDRAMEIFLLFTAEPLLDGNGKGGDGGNGGAGGQMIQIGV